MKKIIFSVVIPLYNKEKYIKSTISSVLHQTWPFFEIVIINDGSTDRGVDIIDEIKDERIRLITQKNSGVSVARNNGIKEAKYDWVAFLDGDDEWDSNFLENMAYAIKNTSEFIAYASGYKKFNASGNLFYPKLRYTPRNQGKLINYYKSCFWGPQILTSSSICINKQILKNRNLFKLFPKGIKRGEDLDAWTKLNLLDNVYFINKTLVTINSVADNVSNSMYNIDESFNYPLWLNYKTNSWKKKIFLFVLVMKREAIIFKKLILKKQFKDIKKLIKRWTN